MVIKIQRQRVSEAFSTVQSVVLSSCGPAGIQVGTSACAAVGMVLYVLVSKASDLLFNLENNTLVVVSADGWQMRGVASVLAPAAYPNRLAIARTPAAAWSEVVEINPSRLQLDPTAGQGQGETIDVS